MHKCHAPMHASRKTAHLIVILMLLSACFFGCQFAPALGLDDPNATIDTGKQTDGPTMEQPTTPGSSINDPSNNQQTEFPTNNQNNETPPRTFYNPLTGLPATETQSLSRPIAVCIGNTSSSLPQYGISDAEILVEAPVEGGGTRLMAIVGNYQSVPCFGSVRSTRDYLISIANAFDAFSVHAGLSDVKAASSYEVGDSLDYISQNLTETFFRDSGRQSPHNLMTSGALLSLAIGDTGYRTTIQTENMPYRIALSPAAVTGRNISASRVELPFSSIHKVYFTYDAAKKCYLRYQNGMAHTDGYTKNQLSYTNLIVLMADSATKTSSTGEVTLNIKKDGGTGFYMYGGQAVKINWQTVNNRLVVTDMNGAPLTVATGQTYITYFRTASLLPVTME